MKLPRLVFPLLLATLVSGCFQGKDELTLRPDGSGIVRLTFHFSAPDELLSTLMQEGGAGGAPLIYPPVTEVEARRFFPAKDFALKFDEASTNDGKAFTIEATFTNVNAMLASPYAKAHQLTLKRDLGNHVLMLQAVSAAEALARAANFKPEGGDMDMLPGMLVGTEDLQKKKKEMAFEFRVTLPNPITDANGTKDGKTVTWAAERAKCKDDDEFAAKLSGTLEAKCADSVAFSPKTPTRMGLLPFAQLAAGKTASTVILPDSSKILSAARFVPYALQVTRSLDLSGEGSGSGSMALLVGAVVLPADLAPQKWANAKLEAVVDAQGNSLVPKQQEADRYGQFGRYSSYGVNSRSDEEADPDSEAPTQAIEQKRVVTLAFKAPEWKVKKLAQVKGSVELQYFGDPEIVKLTNAVSAGLVMNPRSLSGLIRSSGGKEPQKVEEPRLSELGFELTVEGAVVQGGMTMLQLEAGTRKASLLDLQVFDAEGRAWPTLLPQTERDSGSESQSLEVMIPGEPKPPFSLGLLLSGAGTSVKVPLAVENVPLNAK